MDPLLLGRALGRITLEDDDRLVLETRVEDALEPGRELLDRLVGDAIELRGVEHDGVQLPLGNHRKLL